IYRRGPGRGRLAGRCGRHPGQGRRAAVVRRDLQRRLRGQPGHPGAGPATAARGRCGTAAGARFDAGGHGQAERQGLRHRLLQQHPRRRRHPAHHLRPGRAQPQRPPRADPGAGRGARRAAAHRRHRRPRRADRHRPGAGARRGPVDSDHRALAGDRRRSERAGGGIRRLRPPDLPRHLAERTLIMARYLFSRVLQAIWVLWAAFTLSFAVLYLLPADPVAIAADSAAGAGTPVDAAALDELRARYGLDRPVWAQYVSALGNAVRGDFGLSIASGRPVTEAIGSALPATLELAGLALLLAVAGGVALAFAADHTRRPWLRGLLAALPPVGVSVPTFWTGLILLQLFSFQLRLAPAFGGEGLRGTILPAITLALPIGAVIAQVLSAGLESTWRQ